MLVFLNTDDLPVFHDDDAVRHHGDFARMGDEDDGFSLLVNLVEQDEDRFA